MSDEARQSLSHFDDSGRPRMVDVSAKPTTTRTATAAGFVRMSKEALDIVVSRKGKKGDAASVAEIAGVMGAKQTPILIPMCHPLPITGVSVEANTDRDAGGVRVTVTVKTNSRTGVEMEALTAVAIACLTLYDMVKSVDRAMTIEDIALVEKTGGAGGAYRRSADKARP